MEHLKYRVDLPYPSTDDILPNHRDLMLIFNNYAGLYSEFMAVTQYFYHHLYTNDEISQTLMGIAISEMTHLDLFGEAIKKLGGDPKFIFTNNRNMNYWWGGNLVDYSKKITPILISDIELEEKAIIDYSKQSKLVSQESIRSLLDRIILDEQLHLKLLVDLKEKYS